MSNETTTATKDVAQEERVVILYATRGSKKEKITTAVTTWGELKTIAKKAGFEVDKLHCAENVGKHNLVHEDAILPTGPFTVFMTPKETKSGAMDRKELFAAIKEFVGNDKERKALFIIDGKNMTQLSTPKLEELYAQHIAGKTSSASTSTKEVVKEKPAKKETAKVTKSPIVEVPAGSEVDTIINNILFLAHGNPEIISEVGKLKALIGSNTSTTSETSSRTSAVEEAKAELKREQEEKEAKERAEAEERKRIEREEDEALAAEAKKFEKGYK